MLSYFSFSPLNSLPFVDVKDTQIENTDYIHFGRDLAQYRERYFDSKDNYIHNVNLSDTLFFQLNTNIPTDSHVVSLTIYDDKGVDVYVLPQTSTYQIVDNLDDFGNYLYTCHFQFRLDQLENQYTSILLGEGNYRFSITQTDGTITRTFVSEEVNARESHPNTILIKVNNSFNDFGSIFNTPYLTIHPRFNFRVQGTINRLTPESEDTYFEEQDKSLVNLKTRPYRIYKVQFGVDNGVPDWVIDKLNYFMSCDNIRINNNTFVKEENSKFEIVDIGSTLVGASVNVRDKDIFTPYKSVSGTSLLFTIDSYPSFIFSESITDGGNILQIASSVVVQNSSDLQDLVDSLNNATNLANLGLEGTFTRVSNNVFYNNEDGETYESYEDNILNEYIELTATVTSDPLELMYSNGYVGVLFDTPIASIFSGAPNTWQTVSYTYATTGTKSILFFFSDTATGFGFESNGTSSVLVNVANNFPLQINSIHFSGANFSGGLDSSILSVCEPNLKRLTINTCLFVSFSGNIFATFPYPSFPNLQYIDLANNDFDSAIVDDFINNMWNDKYWGGGGSLFLDGNITPAPPTGASLTALTDLISGGWYIITD